MVIVLDDDADEERTFCDGEKQHPQKVIMIKKLSKPILSRQVPDELPQPGDLVYLPSAEAQEDPLITSS